MLTIIYLQNLESVFRSGFVGHRVPCFTSWGPVAVWLEEDFPSVVLDYL